jgi:hypothetical protein
MQAVATAAARAEMDGIVGVEINGRRASLSRAGNPEGQGLMQMLKNSSIESNGSS